MKRLYWIVPILLILGTWLYFNYSTSDSIDAMALIPSDALYVVDSEQPIESWKTISNHTMWQDIKSHPYLEDLTEQANYLDTLLLENPILFKALGHRRLVISAHKTTRTDYDFLFVVDLKNSAKKQVALTAIREIYELSGYNVTEKKHKDHIIYQTSKGNEDPFYLTQFKQQLICSYRLSFIHKALSDKHESKLIHNPSFNNHINHFNKDGLGQVYVNFNLLDKLAMCYMDDGMDVMKDIRDMATISALNLYQNETSWHVEGVTALDSNPSFLRAALDSRPQPSRASHLLSNRTAWFLSLTFESFSEFQDALFEADNALKSSYETNTKRLETVLNISTEQDLTSWIGNEVVVAQMRKNRVLNKDDNYVALVRTSDRRHAEERLNYITEQIKSRTPAKFKQIEYRNHVIRYLDIKGFFKTFIGKTFDKIQRPYYLFLEDYVVFSNSPYTLVGLIEDYENKRSLIHDKRMPQIEPANVTVYYAPPNLHAAIAPLINGESKKEFNANKVYFDQFDHGLITLKKKGKDVSTILLLQKSTVSNEPEAIEKDYNKLYRKFAQERDINSETFVLEWIKDNQYVKRFPGSETIAIKASTKKGVLHGSYAEYDREGNILIEGKYKNGQKKGTWKYYNEDGTVRKRKF